MDEGHIKAPYSMIGYKRTGAKSDARKIPLLCLHGGPGFPSDYLSDLEALGNEREVIFYDQSGCGRSCKVQQSKFTIDHFAQEIDIVRGALKLDDIALFGHSWGGLLAFDYLLREPKGVRCAVLASPLTSAEGWIHDITTAVKTLPEPYSKALLGAKRGRLFNNAMRAFRGAYGPHGDRTGYDLSNEGFNEEIYETMWGSEEFICEGTLRDYDRSSEVSKIETPVLITCGTFDGMRPKSARRLAARLPHGQSASFTGAGHFAHNDFPKRYTARVRKFLREHNA